MDHYATQVHPSRGQSDRALFDAMRDRLFAYDLFPPWLVRAVFCPAGHIAEGTTIVQQVRLGPAALEMAVRVVELWDHEGDSIREAGFTYVTLEGHAECGISTFQVRLDRDGRVLVLIDVRSRPGLAITRLGRPFTRAFQRGITLAALRRLSRTRAHPSVF